MSSNGEGHLPASWNSPSGWFLFCPFETANQTNTPNGIWVSQRGCHVKAWQEEGDQLGCCPWRAVKKWVPGCVCLLGTHTMELEAKNRPGWGNRKNTCGCLPPNPTPAPNELLVASARCVRILGCPPSASERHSTDGLVYCRAKTSAGSETASLGESDFTKPK